MESGVPMATFAFELESEFALCFLWLLNLKLSNSKAKSLLLQHGRINALPRRYRFANSHASLTFKKQ